MRRGLATLSTAAILAGVLVVALSPGSTAATGFELTRLAGQDRYATAAEISVDAFPDGAADVLIATGLRFPDALAGSFLAGQLDAPLLLTATDSVPQVTIDALETLETQRVTILGGPGVVSEDVAAALASLDSTSASGGKIDVDRVAGTTRYGTASAVATEDGTTAGTVGGKVTAIVGRGDAFPDTLAAGPLAYAAGLPLLLTPTDALHADTKAALEELAVEHVLVLGGSAAVSNATESAIQDARGADSITTQRLAGANRQDTARLIAEYALSTLNFSDELVTLARGDKFPDALAGGPHGGVNLAPTLLTVSPTVLSPSSTTGATRYLNDHSPTLLSGVVLGGTAAVSNSVVTQAEAIGAGDDDTAPTIQSATANSTSETVVLTYNENVECAADSFGQFTFSGATPQSATSITCAGTSTVTLRFGDVTASGTVTYTDDDAETDANDVTDLSGNPAANQSIAAPLSASSTPPTLVSASANVNAETVTARFSKNVACIDAAKAQFRFQDKTPTSASCTGDSPFVTLTFGSPITAAGSKTLTYTDENQASDANDVQDANGNPAQNGSVEATFTGDTTPPELASAVVNVNEDVVIATYTENVICANTAGTRDQFEFSTAVPPSPSSISCDGNRVRLEFTAILAAGTLSYEDDDTAVDANDVRDLEGNPAVSPDSVAATATTDTDGPTMAGAAVNEAADVLRVKWDERVQCSSASVDDFTYTNGSGFTGISCPTTVDADGNTVYSDTIWLYAGSLTSGGTLTYDDTGDVSDTSGNPAASQEHSVGATGTDVDGPTIDSVNENTTNDTVTVTYDEPVTCDNTASARGQFTFSGASTTTPTAIQCDVQARTSSVLTLVFDDVTGPGVLTYEDTNAAADPDDIRDWRGNSALEQTVDAEPPRMTNATIGATSTTMTITYNEPVGCGPVGDRKAHWVYDSLTDSVPQSVTCDDSETVVLTFASSVAPGGAIRYDDLDNADAFYVRDLSEQANPAEDQALNVTS